jgi:hypothetical protein
VNRRIVFLAAMSLVTALAGRSGVAQAAGAGSPPVPPPGGEAKAGAPFGPAEQATLEKEFAVKMNVSVADAHSAFADSASIMDFQQAQMADSRFGAVWVSYEGGYKVHARYTSLGDATSSGAVTALEKKLNRPIERHGGGTSASVLDRVRRQLVAANAEFGIDSVAGMVETNADLSKLGVAIDPTAVRRQTTSVTIVAESTSGGDIYSWPPGSPGWTPACVAGFVIGSNPSPGVNLRGFVTAGHCGPFSGNSGYVSGTAIQQSANVAPLARSCGPIDSEAIRSLSSPTNLDEFAFDKRTYPHPTINFQIANGWYHGQPTLKAGLFQNGATGSNTGVVGGPNNLDYGSGNNRGSTPYCSANQVTGLYYNNLSFSGDSGGPIFLSYAGGWFLAATHVGGPAGGAAGTRVGTFVGDIALPAGWWICRMAQPCN